MKIESGLLVKYFKRDLIPIDQLKKDPGIYVYKVLNLAKRSDNSAQVVVYEAIFNYDNIKVGDVFTMNYEDFIDYVNSEEYPTINQEKIFEPFVTK